MLAGRLDSENVEMDKSETVITGRSPVHRWYGEGGQPIGVLRVALDVLPHDLRRFAYRKIAPKYYWALVSKRKAEVVFDGYSLRPFLEKKCIFVHIPKCAGVSVAHALFGCLGGGHLSLNEYRIVFGKKVFSRMFKFAFVRNPWDRLFSAYRFLRKGGFGSMDAAISRKVRRYATFEDFVLAIANTSLMSEVIHLRPQTYFVQVGRAIPLDFIGRFETLEEDFCKLSEILGVQVGLPKSNVSGDGFAGYRQAYTSKSKDVVARIYRSDIRAFGYEF